MCEDCGKIGEIHNGRWNIQWSNIDHEYRRVRDDYNGRCPKCHRKYDDENNLRGKNNEPKRKITNKNE